LTAEGNSSYHGQSSADREVRDTKKAPVSEDDFKTLNPYQAIRKYITHEVHKTNL